MEDRGGSATPKFRVAGTGVEGFATAARRLRRVVPYGAAAGFGADPATVLPTTPIRVENIEPVHSESYWTANSEWRMCSRCGMWRARPTPVAGPATRRSAG
ncbi:hypothetical protein ACWEPL_15435 [Nonomuraea sp. NPDC004186]